MIRQPRVLHVVDHTGDGGAQIVIRDLIRVLRDRFTFGVAILGRSDRFSDDYEALGVPVYKLGGRYGRWNPSPMLALMDVIRQKDYDLIHTQLLKSNILGTLAANLTGRKIILHDHIGIYPQSLSNYFSNSLVRSSYLKAYRYALTSCKRVIVLTPATQEVYAQYYSVAAQKIAVVPNGVDLQRFRPLPEDELSHVVRDELGLPAATRLVLMIGRLEPEKDWWTFLEVAQRVRQLTSVPCAFLIVGAGSEEQRMRDYVHDHHLDNVHYLGYRDDIVDLLRQADIFLLTSRREAFGLVVVEAMAAGCAVVATQSGGPEAILTDGVDGLLAGVGDAPTLADGVTRLLQDDMLRERLAKCAQRTAAEHYSLETIAARIAAIYSEVLSI
jgi:glycosyltransferase involved in cell wall biosynthesis